MPVANVEFAPVRRPTGVTIIAVLMFLTATSIVLLPGGVRFRGIGTVRGPWVLALSGLYITLGIGLLRQSPWARLATIVGEILGIGSVGLAMMSGLLQERPIFVFVYLVRLPINAAIVWYLLEPEVGRAFTRQEM